MKGLIIKEYWAKLILDGLKSMELRGSKTKIRGTISIIISGTGMVFGTVDLIDCIELTDTDFYNRINEHCWKDGREKISYKKVYGWKLDNPKKFEKPIPYTHKQGCVIWVNLDDLSTLKMEV